MRDTSPRVEVYCLGHDGKPVCWANLTTSKFDRCPSCGKAHRAKYKRDSCRKARADAKTSVFYRPHNFTPEQLSEKVRIDIRYDWPVAIIAERYGITREEVRAINCAHYQRRARIAA